MEFWKRVRRDLEGVGAIHDGRGLSIEEAADPKHAAINVLGAKRDRLFAGRLLLPVLGFGLLGLLGLLWLQVDISDTEHQLVYVFADLSGELRERTCGRLTWCDDGIKRHYKDMIRLLIG